ncbi:hypothetical protein AB0G04_09670 [Actinoplanes sp. NPDC023801]|uniref:hypothetical protein n=1 Tax=Actinoplanes sp. NPDC023801 TaxID=3154595 RepID=UPI0033F72338
MMHVLSFALVLEEVGAVGKGSGGNIRDLDSLFDDERLERLREHARAFCFLAFHGTADTAIADYVRGGTLGDDTPADLMVLFVLDQPAPVATPVGDDSLREWVTIDRGGHPAYRMVRELFDDPPALPGLVVFEELTLGSEVAYLPLGHLRTRQDALQELRDLFALIGEVSAAAKPGKFLDDLGVALHQRGSDYTRTGRRPLREWLRRGFTLARENSGEIVTMVNFFS